MDARTLEERCRDIELLLLDVDGVLTDGSIVYSDDGSEWKAFFVRDGSGLKFWRQAGKRAGIVTGRRSPVVARRAAELDLTVVVQGVDDKLAVWERILAEQGLAPRQACFVGDDAPDLPVLSRSGLAIAVADACPEAQQAAHYVTQAPGGRGAVREAIELILKAQGLWNQVLARYGQG